MRHPARPAGTGDYRSRRRVRATTLCVGGRLGAGTLDFTRYLPRLAEANVLDFCLEVRPRQKAAESLANLKTLIDAYDNTGPPGLARPREGR